MRALPAVLLAALVVLAGCNAVPGLGDDGPGDGNDAIPDPEADAVGWEEGYWHNESIAVTAGDGLNASERTAVVARSMARVEYVRDREFRESVEVEIISRAEFREQYVPDPGPDARTFRNAEYEALFFVGEDRDAFAVESENRGANVLAFYDPRNDTIDLISDSGRPTVDRERTLAHELVHALQDQYHDLSALQVRAGTRDRTNARLALVEGEARQVELDYANRCGEAWDCVGSGAPPAPDINWGIYFLNFFPYSDGPGLVDHLREGGGWGAVEDAFDDPPATAEQAIYSEKYTEPRDEAVPITPPETASGGWERVRPADGPAGHQHPGYDRLGQSALSAMFAATLYGDGTPVIEPSQFLNFEDGRADASDPYDYDLPATDGWEGDRFYVYEHDATGPNETAYVWRIAWESPADAREFVDAYTTLLASNGATPVDDRPGNTWRIPEGRNAFADAIAVHRDGETVTIVNAPAVEDLDDVSPEAAS